MTSCTEPDLRQHLYRFVRHELDDAAERHRVELHLVACSECRGIFDELQWMMGSMRPSTPAEHQQLMAELRRVGEIEPLTDDVRPTEPQSGGLLGRLKRWLSSGGGAT